MGLGASARTFYLDNVLIEDLSPAGNYAVRLNGSSNEKYGLARSVSVMAGDTVNVEVFAKYVDTNSGNWTAALNTLLSQVTAGTFPATRIDGAGYATSTSSFQFGDLMNTTGSTGGPKAYLNWLLFDDKFVLIDGGYQRLSATPKETGQNVAHEKLSATIPVTEAGFVYVYLSNEETSPVEVYFDDFKVEHIISPIIQSQDYYPFGLSFNSNQRENTVFNQYKFNGIEEQDGINLGWSLAEFRSYDPSIGKWGQIDRKSEVLFPFTPYMGMHNNPIRFNDPSGDIAPAIWAAIVYAIETGGETAIDIAMGVTLQYLTGIPYTGWDIAIDYGGNLIPGVGEIRKYKKGAEILTTIEKSFERFSQIEGGVKLFNQVKKGLGDFVSTGNLESLEKIRGKLFEFRLLNSLDNVVGAGSNARQIANFGGLGKEASNQLNKSFGDVTFDVVQKGKDGALNLIEAKSGNFDRFNSLGNLADKAKQFTGKIDFASSFNKAGGNASVEFRFAQSINIGLIKSITDYALQKGVNVKITFN